MKKLLTAVGLAVVTAAIASPVSGITRGGVPDGQDHPYVGLMVAKVDGNPAWRCSGTLISPTLFLTAGHCTDGATSVEVWFDTDVTSGRPGNGYPFTGEVAGTPFTFPDYDDPTFYLYDLGMVVLDEPVAMDSYGALPTQGLGDQIAKGGRKGAQVTTVGYGLQFAGRGVLPTRSDLVRYRADLMIVNTRGATGVGSAQGWNSMLLSGDAKHGGTCFGDSGGPTFASGTNVVLAVTSFGMNSTCAGISGVYRVDTQLALDWINEFD